jgi:hypothetical protein
MSNLPANLQNLVTNLEQTKAAAPSVDVGDFQFLKMDKGGTWIYGADEIEPEADARFVIDPSSYAQGFIAWDDGELVDEKMAIAGEQPITRGDLPDVGAEWNVQFGFALLGLDGDDEGVQLMYKASSRGGKQAINALIDEVIKRGKEGKQDLCPVVELANDSYRHKKYGKIYTPEFNIVEWTTVEAATEATPAEVEDEPEVEEEQPKRKLTTRKRKTTH